MRKRSKAIAFQARLWAKDALNATARMHALIQWSPTAVKWSMLSKCTPLRFEICFHLLLSIFRCTVRYCRRCTQSIRRLRVANIAAQNSAIGRGSVSDIWNSKAPHYVMLAWLLWLLTCGIFSRPYKYDKCLHVCAHVAIGMRHITARIFRL